mgnify:CR=1 FL=1
MTEAVETIKKKTKRAVIVDCGSSFLRSLIDVLHTNKILPYVVPSNSPFDEITSLNPNVIIISGSGLSVNHKKSPKPDIAILQQPHIPVLGICYGLQYITHVLGGEVKTSSDKETGVTEIYFNITMDENAIARIPEGVINSLEHNQGSILYTNFHEGARVWMSHVCQVTKTAPGFITTAISENFSVASIERDNIYGVHFHPEKRAEPDKDTGNGDLILESFLNFI